MKDYLEEKGYLREWCEVKLFAVRFCIDYENTCCPKTCKYAIDKLSKLEKEIFK